MASESASEGEILESGFEKANRVLPPAQHTSVNRRLRDALSPSPPRSPSPPGKRSSNRPPKSRNETGRAPRGEKRRRNDDDNNDLTSDDNRRFKSNYDGRAGYPNHGRQASYRDMDRTNSFNSEMRYDDHDGRSRNLSQSTQIGKPVFDRYNRRPTDYFHKATGARDAQSFDNIIEQSDRKVADNRHRSRGTENGSKNSLQHAPLASRNAATTETANNGSMTANDDSTQDILPPKEITAEERRQLREAIKAKHNTTSKPLLVQALHQSTAPGSPGSPVDTPYESPSRSVSPNLDSAATPQHESASNSPPEIAVADDMELANTDAIATGTMIADGISAADYDPSRDMQEDMARLGKKIHGEDFPASNYDEMQLEADKDILLPASKAVPDQNASSKKSKKDDMFASDSDDDMFAPEAPKTSGGALAVNLSKAKELDMSLLDNWDDKDGYYKVIVSELLDGRYHVQGRLGRGVFSGVVKALDTKNNDTVAIKIIRNNETMIKAGQKEMDILQKLEEADPEDKKHIIRLLRSFSHKGHLCMVFPGLSDDLRGILKKFGGTVGINLKAVRAYAQQIFVGLGLLRKCNILHADLKPDNILVNDARNVLKICDLGSAADASEASITPYLASRFYRAPEIILGMPYDFAIDMWSIGCTLFELYTGKVLFAGNNNNEMLRSMMECRGKLSSKMLKKGEFSGDHFDNADGTFRSREIDKITGRPVIKILNFAKPTRDLKTRLLEAAGAGPGGRKLPDADLKEINLFADLLDRCLTLNPEKRIKPLDALKHPFIHRTATIQPVRRP